MEWKKKRGEDESSNGAMLDVTQHVSGLFHSFLLAVPSSLLPSFAGSFVISSAKPLASATSAYSRLNM
jgi:hypothetical protein